MFDNRLTKLREEKGLNKKEISKELSLPYTTYLNYENDEREPSSETLIQIAKFFDVSVDYLLGISDVRTNNVDIKGIRNTTGLSEAAIVNIKRFALDNPFGMLFLNKLLEDLTYSNNKSILSEIIVYLSLYNSHNEQEGDYFALLSTNQLNKISCKSQKNPSELKRISENDLICKILLENIVEDIKEFAKKIKNM